MFSPPSLQIGDTVAIVAPAKKVAPQEISYAISILESWGLKVILGRHLYNQHNVFAGTDLERTHDLQTMLDDTNIKAIICARGGYGTSRIVDNLDFTTFLQKPKWIVGFSDITALHSELQARGIESIHGIMPLLFSEQTEESIKSLQNALWGNPDKITLSPHPLNRAGKASGELVGGNLSLLINTIGTPSEIDTAGKILFLEDVSEYLYHIDRMMTQLKRANKLEKLAGLIIGDFSKIQDEDESFGKNVQELMADIVSIYGYPVAYDFPIGHGQYNLSLVCGRQAILSVQTEQVILTQSSHLIL